MDRQISKDIYKISFLKLRTLINEWDPYSLIRQGAGEDEFHAETAQILGEIKRCASPDDAAQLVSRIFSQAFDPKDFPADSCKEVAQKIFFIFKSPSPPH